MSSIEAMFGRREVEQLAAADYVEWAIERLVAGQDSASLRVLAGLDPRSTWFEADDLFVRSARELGVEPPERTAAVRAHAREVARGLLDGRVSTTEAVRALGRICQAMKYREYVEWLDLDEPLWSLRPAPPSGGAPDDVAAEARRLARAMLDDTDP